MNPEVSYLRYSDCFGQSRKNIFLLNIHSLRNKLNLLEADLEVMGRPQIVILTETWIEPGSESFYNINGYRSHHATRLDGYGGVSVFVQDHIRHALLACGSHVSNEVQLIRLRFFDQDLDLISFYRKPSERNLFGFRDLLDSVLESTRPIVLAGDANVDLRKHDAAVTRFFLYLYYLFPPPFEIS